MDEIDPIASRDHERRARLKPSVPTFDKCSDDYIAAHEQGWKNEKHKAQWRSTLKTYCSPIFGALPINEIEMHHVTQVLEPIWTIKTETASRLRGRIESVLDWATVKKFRNGDNPARWKGNLEMALAKPSKVTKVKHHSALAHDDIANFITLLRQQSGNAARALEFLILTATRTGEVIGAEWQEIDLEKRMWIIPAHRMKAAREHRITLSSRAIEILEQMQSSTNGKPVTRYVFLGAKGDAPLSNMAMLMLLKRMNYGHLTNHGFRSTFRDWVAEKTDYPHELAEMALAHTINNKVEAAYRRGDMLEKRIQLMQDWADFCYKNMENS